MIRRRTDVWSEFDRVLNEKIKVPINGLLKL